ncbi:hypothetical protein CXB51_009292 [Gossypium anomalum]|uniref:Hydrophobic seed protein domain-containing protein n=1 Tax=Gossypium anomalum TaxID=47600 RepID=A0A8J5ZHI9_9ROSI|nr:hypothetical protein CXB51_009292 [Gossypium anomalum]
MASKALATIALLLSINLLFLSMVNAHNQPKCRHDALLLNVNVALGWSHRPCCNLIKGLVGLELDACLFTFVKANVLRHIKVEAPLQLTHQ